MPTCEHEKCGRDALGGPDGDDLCILHSEDPKKDGGAFWAAFEEHRKQHGDKFSHFVFPESVRFRGQTFDEADFSAAKFSGAAEFSGAQFSGDARFGEAQFSKEASFVRTRFAKKADFHQSRVTGRTIFFGATGEGGEQLIFSGAKVDFGNLIVEPLDALTFRDADLRKCRFLGTDLRKAEITGAMWPEIPWHPDPRQPRLIRRSAKWARVAKRHLGEKYPKLKRRYDAVFGRIGRRIGVYDEIGKSKLSKNYPWSHIERLYRELKQNYEDRKDYERAGDFHYGEKEMRRKNPETPWGLWFALSLYWLVSGYGERWVRPLLWLVGLLAISTLGYLWFGLSPKSAGGGATCGAGPDLWTTIEYSVRVMTLLKPDNLAPEGWSRLVNLVQSLLGPVLIGLFALALRQRLRR